MDEGQELVALFASLPLEEQRLIMVHTLNRLRLQPFRNLLDKIALTYGDLKTYANLRCTCRHFRKWLEPITAPRVTAALVMPHVKRLQRLFSVSSRICDDPGFKLRLVSNKPLPNQYDDENFLDIDKRTGWIRKKSGRIVGHIEWSNRELEQCFKTYDLVPEEYGRNSSNPIYRRLVDLNRPKKKLKR